MPALRVQHEPEGVSLWRGANRLAGGLPPEVAADPALAHDTIGWELLLQEVWGQPDWLLGRFYTPAPDDGRAAIFVPGRALTVEASADVPAVITNLDALDLTLTVGGLPVCQTRAPVSCGRLGPGELISLLTHAAGMDLCRVTVRQALLGRLLTAPPLTLRARLAEAARGAPVTVT